MAPPPNLTPGDLVPTWDGRPALVLHDSGESITLLAGCPVEEVEVDEEQLVWQRCIAVAKRLWETDPTATEEDVGAAVGLFYRGGPIVRAYRRRLEDAGLLTAS